MPAGDGTGPRGLGPMTGRGAAGQGRAGRGSAMGRGVGRGRGGRFPTPPTDAEPDAAFLRAQLETLKKDMEGIEKRLAALKKKD